MDPIILTCQNQLATLTFNRPEKLNTFNYDMIDLFKGLCQKIKEDETIRVVLMRGTGETFLSGIDLHELNHALDPFTQEALAIVRQFNACMLMLHEMDKMVIAAVHGLVMGIGMSAMLAADMVVSSENAKFSMGYNRIALSAAGASSYLLPRIVGERRALELLVMSEIFSAQEAYQFGLVNWVVPEDQLADKTQHVIEQLLHGPTVAITQTKQLLNAAWQNKLTAQMELEAESFVKCVNTKDFKTAVRAFVNKRVPEFEGR